MRTTLWRNLRGHARRMVSTGLAVLFAVGFISGTFIFTDTARAGYYDTYARTARSIDVSVQPASDAKSSSAALTPVHLEKVRSVDGIGTVDARMRAPLGLEGRSGRGVTNLHPPRVPRSPGPPARPPPPR